MLISFVCEIVFSVHYIDRYLFKCGIQNRSVHCIFFLYDKNVKGVIESLKIITRHGSERVARYAFEYAVKQGRKKVTAVHKANIM